MSGQHEQGSSALSAFYTCHACVPLCVQDYVRGYVFEPLNAARTKAGQGQWDGGLNTSNIAQAEARAYGWYWYFVRNATADIRPYLRMNRPAAGTGTGLAKMPYLRESRRLGRGLKGFRLSLPMMAAAERFEDVVGIGTYPVDMHMMDCPSPLPGYLGNRTVSPFYFPFRALASDEIQNLLVAGKGIAQTFHANAATREHPQVGIPHHAPYPIP